MNMRADWYINLQKGSKNKLKFCHTHGTPTINAYSFVYIFFPSLMRQVRKNKAGENKTSLSSTCNSGPIICSCEQYNTRETMLKVSVMASINREYPWLQSQNHRFLSISKFKKR